MSKFGRFIGILLVTLSAHGWALPITWEHTHTFESEPHVIRDGSSNMYLLTIAKGPGGLFTVCRKYNALGQLQWREQVDVTPSLGSLSDGFIAGLAWSGTRVYAGLTIHNHNFANTEGRIVSFDTSSGTGLKSPASSIDRVIAIGYAGGHLALAGRDDSFDKAVVQYFNPTTLASVAEASFGTDLLIASAFAMDSSGNAYFSFQEIGSSSLAKVTPSGSTAWKRTLDAANLTNERYSEIAVDSSANVVYAIGAAKSGTSDVPLFSVHSSSTGIAVYSGNRTGDTGGFGRDLGVVPGIGVWVSIHVAGQYRLFRATTAGALSWTTPTFSGLTSGYHGFARDFDGNTVFGFNTSTTNTAFRRYSNADGKLASTFNVAAGSAMTLGNYLTDPAGNFYLARSFDTGVSLARAQPADLTIVVNNVVGGSSSLGRITLNTPAPATQTWSLFSSDPAVASVPATVNVPTSSTTAFFNITTTALPNNGAVTISARFGGLALAKTLTILTATLSSITVTPLVSLGGQTPTGTVSLNGAAPAAGRVVSLTSSKPDVAAVPSSVAILSGDSSASFGITTSGVNANQGVVLTATLNSISRTVFMAVNAPALTSIAAVPTSVQGGQTGGLQINLDGIAPAGGRSILLFSGAPGIVILPSSYAVPEGQTTVTAPVLTTAVTTSINVTIFATRSGIHKTTTVTVTP
jgi:hypothetical protein